ncbi:hypothetical protein KAU11_00890 [Candidatus Babeliales bacterium]|nr:hypothetical protein [Candidatus Babeliales bacterium]
MAEEFLTSKTEGDKSLDWRSFEGRILCKLQTGLPVLRKREDAKVYFDGLVKLFDDLNKQDNEVNSSNNSLIKRMGDSSFVIANCCGTLALGLSGLSLLRIHIKNQKKHKKNPFPSVLKKTFSVYENKIIIPAYLLAAVCCGYYLKNVIF